MNKYPCHAAHGRRFRDLLIWLVAFVGGSGLASGQTSAASKLPASVASIEPAELIKLMPPPPPDWKLISSYARNEVSSETGSETFAIRNYLYIPPPDPAAAAGTKPPVPQKTQITLMDTGFDPSAAGEFTEFKSGTTFPGEKNVRRFLLSGCPAVLRTLVSGKLKLTINLALRFNVYIELEQQPEANLQKWVESLNLPTLAQAALSAPRKSIPPHQLRLSRVDELDPKANSSRMESYITPAEMEAIDKAARAHYLEAEKNHVQE